VIGTEAEFHKKRCTPALQVLIARAINFESYQASVVSENVSVGLNCVGSKCAQWCWYDYANDAGRTFFLNESQSREFMKGRRSPHVTGQQNNFEMPARGYCGLTGTRE
jgi:hypothetical protein